MKRGLRPRTPYYVHWGLRPQTPRVLSLRRTAWRQLRGFSPKPRRARKGPASWALALLAPSFAWWRLGKGYALDVGLRPMFACKPSSLGKSGSFFALIARDEGLLRSLCRSLRSISFGLRSSDLSTWSVAPRQKLRFWVVFSIINGDFL